MLIRCSTKFDITATGVKGNFNRNRIPFQDDADNVIEDQISWMRSRNQQRNWETINQVLSLRVLPTDITAPHREKDSWIFEFVVEQPAGLESDGDPLGALKSDCRDVPMITDLDESADVGNVLMVNSNVFFQCLDAK